MPGSPRQQYFSADSEDTVYAIPAIGLSVPITDKFLFGDWVWRVWSDGLGVDYRDTVLDQTDVL